MEARYITGLIALIVAVNKTLYHSIGSLSLYMFVLCVTLLLRLGSLVVKGFLDKFPKK